MALHASPASAGLSTQIDILQEGFRRLPKTAGMKDLARQFAAVVGEFFPSSSLDLLQRAEGAKEWETIVETGTRVSQEHPILRGGEADPLRTLQYSAHNICITQPLADRTSFGIVLSQKQGGERYSEIDALRLQLFVHLFEHAHQELLYRKTEKGLIFSLNQRVLQLTSLIDTGIEIAKLDQRTSPLQVALERAASLTNASRGRVRVIHGEHIMQEFSFPEGMVFDAVPESANTVAARFAFQEETYTFELYGKESRTGTDRFEETDQLLLDALARQVHASLENRYLLKQALEKQKIEQDLSVAASIQRRILPTTLPVIEGYDIAGITIPSITVGGDYYDCIPLPDGRLALIIADVAGKGISAALLVSTFHAFLRAYLESPSPLAELARRLNRSIGEAATDEKFISAFIAVLSPETGQVEALNAGHPPALWLRGGDTVEELGVGGVPLAMLDMDFPYEVQRVTLGRGDRLFLYTDGVTEAQNAENVLFEKCVPLGQFFATHRPESAETFISELLREIRNFAGTATQSDDITAIYLIRR